MHLSSFAYDNIHFQTLLSRLQLKIYLKAKKKLSWHEILVVLQLRSEVPEIKILLKLLS